jgi:hypothetical protein
LLSLTQAVLGGAQTTLEYCEIPLHEIPRTRVHPVVTRLRPDVVKHLTVQCKAHE